MLMTEHNLCFYQRLMEELREAIAEGRLAAYADGVPPPATDKGSSSRPPRDMVRQAV